MASSIRGTSSPSSSSSGHGIVGEVEPPNLLITSTWECQDVGSYQTIRPHRGMQRKDPETLAETFADRLDLEAESNILRHRLRFSDVDCQTNYEPIVL